MPTAVEAAQEIHNISASIKARKAVQDCDSVTVLTELVKIDTRSIVVDLANKRIAQLRELKLPDFYDPATARDLDKDEDTGEEAMLKQPTAEQPELPVKTKGKGKKAAPAPAPEPEAQPAPVEAAPVAEKPKRKGKGKGKGKAATEAPPAPTPEPEPVKTLDDIDATPAPAAEAPKAKGKKSKKAVPAEVRTPDYASMKGPELKAAYAERFPDAKLRPVTSNAAIRDALVAGEPIVYAPPKAPTAPKAKAEPRQKVERPSRVPERSKNRTAPAPGDIDVNAQKECPKCHVTKPIGTGFGLRNMRSFVASKGTFVTIVRPQSQCKDCRAGRAPGEEPKRRGKAAAEGAEAKPKRTRKAKAASEAPQELTDF